MRRRGGEEIISLNAGVTQLVECNLAKVDVEGSNPFARSRKKFHELSLGKFGRLILDVGVGAIF